MAGFRTTVLAAMSLALIASSSAEACRPPDSPRDPAQPATDKTRAKVEAGAPKVVSFPTSDGGLIYADLYGQGDHAVILAHGARFTKESWKSQAPVLARAGFRVLAIDFRGRGKSRGGPNAKRGERHPEENSVKRDCLRHARRNDCRGTDRARHG